MRFPGQKAVCAVLLAVMIGGCGHGQVTPEWERARAAYEKAPYVTDAKDLASGEYAASRDGRLYRLYIGRASFDTASGGYGPTRTLWFSEEELSLIPTLYEGDELVFRADAAFTERFVFERFFADGYTIGICNLKQTPTGRYRFDAVEGNANIAPGTDAEKAVELSARGVVIDRIGGGTLRSGGVSEGGTVRGLVKGERYAADLYVGTKLVKETFTADVYAMTSHERYVTTDYEFLPSGVLKVTIPEWFETGYYRIGGGVFRYVKGHEWSEETDFNKEIRITEEEELSPDEKSVWFVMRRQARVFVTVDVYGEGKGAPLAVISGEDDFSLSGTGSTLSGSFLLPTGRYCLKITGLEGRNVRYQMTADGGP